MENMETTKLSHVSRACLVIVSFMVPLGLQAADLNIPEQLKTYYSSEAPAFGILPQMGQEGGGAAFIEFVVKHWRDIVSSFDSFAKTEAQRDLVVVAAEFLPPQDYIQFLQAVCDKADDGKVPFATIQCIVLARMKKEGFLAFNYDRPDVIRLIRRFKELTPPRDGETRQLLDYIENGGAKAELVSLKEANEEPLPERLNGAQSDLSQPNPTRIAGAADSKSWLRPFGNTGRE